MNTKKMRNRRNYNMQMTVDTTPIASTRWIRTLKVVKDISVLDLKKGDVVRFDSHQCVLYRLDKSQMGILLPLDPNNHNWFVDTYLPKFENGQYVIFNDTYNNNTVKRFCFVDSFDPDLGDYNLKVATGNQVYLNVNENKIEAVETYWFFNSKGQICLTYVGRDKEADSYRKITNNWYRTKADAQEYRAKIEEEMISREYFNEK